MTQKTININKKEPKLATSFTDTGSVETGEPRLSNKNKVKTLDMNSGQKPKRKRSHKTNRKLMIFLFIFFIILGIAGAAFAYFIFLPVQRIYDSGKRIENTFYSAVADLREKNISQLEEYLSQVKSEITNINREIDRFDFLENWDQTKGYYDNFTQAQVILAKGDKLITNVLPELTSILEVSGFKVNETAEEQGIITSDDTEEEEEESAVTLIMKELPQYLNLYDEIEPQIIDILAEFEKIDPDYIPEVGDYDLKEKLDELNAFSKEFPELSNKTKNFVKFIPELIGASGQANYLLVLQTEAELRSSSGILTAYGHTSITNGEFNDDIFLRDMWDLNDYVAYTLGIDLGHRNIYGQNWLMNHGCGASYLRPQDAGLYPDLYESMWIFKDYYDVAGKYNKERFPAYDYIVTFNNSFAERLLKIVEPIKVDLYDGEITSQNFFEVIKLETDNGDKYTGAEANDRKEIIKQIADAAKEKFLDLSFADIPKVIESMIQGLQAKDIGLVTKDTEMQAFFDDYGLSARTVKDFPGDYFQLNEAQNCSLKLNKFVRDSIETNVYIADDGSIKRDAFIKWEQPVIYSDEISRLYSSTYNYSYRAWVRLFMPKNASNVVSNGYHKSGYLYYWPQFYYDSKMDKAVSDNIIQFDHRRFSENDPIRGIDMSVSWTLPGDINYETDGEYTLVLQKHPGKSWGEPYKVNIQHEGTTQSVDIVLDRDKILRYKDGIISVDNYDTKLDWITELVKRIPWDKITSTD